MVCIEKCCRIIYYVILIIFTLTLLVLLFWRPSSSFGGKCNNDIDDPNGEYSEDIDDDHIATGVEHPKKYKYNKYKAELSMSNVAQKLESTINYKEFLSICFNEKFLEDYRQSLEISFREKKQIYRRKQLQLTKDLTKARCKTKTTFGIIGHDTKIERLNKSKIEIDFILNAIDQRISTLSIEQIENDFCDMIDDPVNGMESVIGREEIKDFLALQIFTFARNPRLFFTNFQNIIVTGKSGVGKTKLSQTIGYVYAKSGILVRRKFRSVTKQAFTSSYVNESSQLTREVLESVFEGVIHIDEAYDLAPNVGLIGRTIDHGSEAIVELVNHLDKNAGLSVVIASGYEDEMKHRFLTANQGLERRFPHVLNLDNYDSRQLTDILLRFINKSAPDLSVSNEDASYMYTLVDFSYSNHQNIFDKQAGDMLILSGYIIRSIYGSKLSHWKKNNIKNNATLILDGFNNYLQSRNISIIQN